MTQPDGTVDVSLQRKDGSAERTASDGTVFTSRRGPEPRFGMQSPILTEATVVTPGGRTSTTTASRTVTFLDPNGDKQDPANVVESLREIDLDIAEGADLVMVKPAMSYLDVVAAAAERSSVPVAAYQVSGEYAMISAAAANGWIDRRAAALESLLSIRRAGAQVVLTYFALEAADWID